MPVLAQAGISTPGSGDHAGIIEYDDPRPHAASKYLDEQVSYDAAGNLTRAQNLKIVYDDRGLPIRIGRRGGGTLSLLYDANRRRVKSKFGRGVIRRTFMDYEYVDGSSREDGVSTIVVNGRPIAKIVKTRSDETTYFLHQDHQNSISLITATKGDRRWTAARQAFGPYGRPQQRTWTFKDPKIPFRHGYTGHRHDEEVGLINMNARLYHPGLRRMTSPDPIVSNPLSQQANNAYSYVVNNPLTLIDPTGLQQAVPGYDYPYSGRCEYDSCEGPGSMPDHYILVDRSEGTSWEWTEPEPIPQIPDHIISDLFARGELSPDTESQIYTPPQRTLGLPINNNCCERPYDLDDLIMDVTPAGDIFSLLDPNASATEKALSAGAFLPVGRIVKGGGRIFKLIMKVANDTPAKNAARKALSRALPGLGGEAHHLIPLEHRNHPLVRLAEQGGFEFNGLDNGVRLPTNIHRGSHAGINRGATRTLNDLWRLQPYIRPTEAAQLLREINEATRLGLTHRTLGPWGSGSRKLH